MILLSHIGPGCRTELLPSAAADQQLVGSILQAICAHSDAAITWQQLQSHFDGLGLPGSDEQFVSELMMQYGAQSRCAETVSTDNVRRYVQRVSRKITDAFAALDATGDGTITAAKLLAALRRMGCDAATEVDASRMVQMLDSDGSNAVTLQDFARYACFLPEAQLTSDNVAFCWLDSADVAAGMDVRLHMVRPSLQRI